MGVGGRKHVFGDAKMSKKKIKLKSQSKKKLSKEQKQDIQKSAHNCVWDLMIDLPESIKRWKQENKLNIFYFENKLFENNNDPITTILDFSIQRYFRNFQIQTRMEGKFLEFLKEILSHGEAKDYDQANYNDAVYGAVCCRAIHLFHFIQKLKETREMKYKLALEEMRMYGPRLMVLEKSTGVYYTEKIIQENNFEKIKELKGFGYAVNGYDNRASVQEHSEDIKLYA